MNGKKVGVTSGAIQNELLKKWCSKKNIQLDFVEYEDISKKEADLYAGKIDLNLELSMPVTLLVRAGSSCQENSIVPYIQGTGLVNFSRPCPDNRRTNPLSQWPKNSVLPAGMNGHITKPLKIDVLLNALKRFIV